jgi:type I restriction enzyme S subunit
VNLKSYPKYRDSGVTWMGNIPGNWIILRNKNFLSETIIQSVNGTEELLTVSQYTGITKRRDRLKEETDLLTTAKSLEGYKIVEKQEMVMNIMLAWNGSLGVSEFDGIVSPAYCVFRINKELANPRYLHYLHRTKLYTGVFETASTGVIKSRLRLYPEKYLALKSVLPPVQEQIQIARYLDWKTTQIAKFIKAKKRLIELLKEQKQVFINDAVTGKIDVRTGKPYPKYKDSGVEWLGMVPEDWEVRRLKFLVKGKLKYGANASGIEYSSSLPRYIRITDFDSNGKISDKNKLSLTKDLGNEYLVEEGDILYARSGATVGKSFQCKGLKELSCFAGYLIKATPNQSIITSNFLFNYNQSFAFNFWKNYSFIKATIENIGADKYSQLHISYPKIDLQLLINDWILEKTQKISSSISKIENELELIMEYRARLITDAVTGKIDVRDINVPIFDEVNLIPDVEMQIEDEELLDDATVVNV